MGVKGLTTYLQEHAAAVSHEQTFGPVAADGERTPLVVDAWGLIYALVDQLPMAYGGEYLAFGKLVKRTVEGWQAMGFDLVMVLDGPVPAHKFDTEIARMSSLLHELFLFHHTSPGSRSHPSALRKMRVLPPLCYSAFVDVALALGVECVFAESEADDEVAAVAAARGGYVVGLDSDFVVYSSHAEGGGSSALGYIPINSMRWEVVSSAEDDDAQSQPDAHEVDADGFSVVKAKRKPAAHLDYLSRPVSPLPPFVPHPAFLTSMTCLVLTPALLAASLQLPVRLLPLFASLVGNDYVNHSARLQYRASSAVEKVERVARHLREALLPRKGVKEPEGLTELLERTVASLMVQPVGEAEMDSMIHSLLDSTTLYALHRPAPSAPLSPSPVFVSQHRDAVLPQYAAAMRAGEFAPKLAGAVRDGRYVVRPWLEDTTRRSVGRVAGDGVRAAWSAVLRDAVGLGYTDPGVEQALAVDEDADHEPESRLAAAATAGEGEDGDAADADEEMAEELEEDDHQQPADVVSDAQPSAGDNHAEEVARQGSPDVPEILVFHRSSTTMHASCHPIPSLSSILASYASDQPLSPSIDALEGQESVVAQPLAWRLQLHLALLGSLTAAVLALSHKLLPPVLALRSTLHALAREGEKGVKGRLRRVEVEALVLASLRASGEWSRWLTAASELGEGQEPPPPPPFDRTAPVLEISNRNVHVTSHFVHALHETDLARQALLIPSSTLPRAHRYYSGKLTHALLTDLVDRPDSQMAFDSPEEEAAFRACVAAVFDGETGALLAAELEVEMPKDGKAARAQRKKEAKKARAAQEAAKMAGGGDGAAAAAGVKRGFALLGEAEA